jgi:hypothetical protein
MRFYSLGVTVLMLTGVSGCVETCLTDRVELRPPGPVKTVTEEQGVVPSGTSLVVRTNDTVSTRKALRETIYDAKVAENVLDQNGSVLIPKESPVELRVLSLSFLGPGGAGMTELVLGVRAVTVNGVRYPVETAGNARDRNGGLERDRYTAKWIGGSSERGEVLTSGRRINVPVGTLLAFQTGNPIRLKGYQR